MEPLIWLHSIFIAGLYTLTITEISHEEDAENTDPVIGFVHVERLHAGHTTCLNQPHNPHRSATIDQRARF